MMKKGYLKVELEIEMKITALIENREEKDLNSEHGLCVHIEYKGKNYLLDTGASDKFIDNAKMLGIDLRKIEAAILSHAHYDHSGGYSGFFAMNKTANLYLQAKAKENCYSKIGMFHKYIGIPKGTLEKYKDRIVPVEGDAKIANGVWLISHKPQKEKEMKKKGHMYCKMGQGFVLDDFLHEQSLVFERSRDLVLLNSCCHTGIDSIVKEVNDFFAMNEKKVSYIFGGFHLMGLMGPTTMKGTEENIEKLGEKLLKQGVKEVYTGHCTGTPAFEVLQRVLGDNIKYLKTGSKIEL